MATLNIVVNHYQPNSNPQDPSKIRNNLLTPKLITLHPFPFKKNISTRKLHLCLVPRSIQKPSEHDNEPRKAPEGLFASMKNRYFKEFLELIGDKPQSLHYDPLTLLILQTLLKKQCSLVLSSLMAFIANHSELVVKLTTEDGLDVGIRWNFEWKNRTIPLGPLCRLYTTHKYSGKILLRNGKALIEPLLHLEVLNKKLKEIVMPVLERILPHSVLRGERKVARLLNCLLALFCMILSLILWKDTFM